MNYCPPARLADVLDIFSPSKTVWSAPCSSLIGVDRKAAIDGPPIVVGVVTVLNQFRS